MKEDHDHIPIQHEGADFHGSCSSDGTKMSWYWTNVPTDDREPGLDRYFVQVVDTTTGEPIGWFPGAEDNAWGVPYTVDIVPGRDYWVQVQNEADGFHFEDDVTVSCPAVTTSHVHDSYIMDDPTTYEQTADPILSVFMVLWALWNFVGRFTLFG
jgi:hypothetical protein